VAQIVFTDGVIWTEADLEAQILAQQEAQSGGTVVIYGFDRVVGSSDGNDTLVAGMGNTELVGGTGDDTYIWKTGDGATRIDDQGDVHGWSPVGAWEINTLRLEGIAPADLSVMRDPTPNSTDLILRAAGQKPIILTSQTTPYGNRSGVEQVVFDDGTVWDAAELVVMADGIPTVPNGTTARAFDGTPATATLYGTDQDDTYFWGAGDGNDTISETFFSPARQKADVVRLVGLNPSDITLGITTSGWGYNQTRNLVITNAATGETLTIISQFDLASNDGSNAGPGGGPGIEALAFADGTLWFEQQILDHSVYVVSPGSNTISNLGLGSGGIPIAASPGATYLYGLGNRDDTYIWSPGDGSDTISDGPDPAGHIDTLVLHDLRPGDVELSLFNGDLLIIIPSTGERIIVSGHVFGSEPGVVQGQGIEQIRFDNGTVWSRTQVLDLAPSRIPDGNQAFSGWGVGPIIIAGHGNETFYDDDRSHTFIYARGDGNDTIITGIGPEDRQMVLDLTGIARADLKFQREFSANDPFQTAPSELLITDTATGNTILLNNQFAFDGNSQSTREGATEIVFDDGTVMGRDDIAAAADTTLPPPPRAGNFVLHFDGTITVIPAAVILANDFDYFGRPLSLVSVDQPVGGTATLLNGDVVFTPTNSTDFFHVFNYTIANDAGLTASSFVSLFDADYLPQAVDDSDFSVQAGQNVVITLDQLLANDINAGGLSILTLVDPVGGTVSVDNDGNVVFTAAADASGPASFIYILTDQWNDEAFAYVHLTVEPAATPLAITSQLLANDTGSSQIDNVTSARQGLGSNDAFTGTSGNDVLVGGGGNDTLIGGGGYDTYRVGTNMGQTAIDNLASDGVTGANGEVDFGAGISDQQLWFERTGNDLQVDLLGTANHLTVSGWYAGNARAQVQSFNTADGLKLDSQLAQLVSAMATYSAGNSGFDPTQVSQAPADPTLQGTIAAAWHA
jgi:Ca2+-binding RTX toxin-like protein